MHHLLFRLGMLCVMVAGFAGCADSDDDSGGHRPRVRARTSAGPDVLDALPVDDSRRGSDAEIGQMLYANSCMSCHGARGQGMPHQGVDLRMSRFIAQRSDGQLLEFLKQGRSAQDPQSVQRLPMPPRGGNPTLDDRGLGDIVAFLRLLQEEAAAENPASADASPLASDAPAAPERPVAVRE